MSRNVSALKFIGTGSLGLLTGLSYTLTTISLPSIMALTHPSSAHAMLERTVTPARLSHLTTFTSAAFLAAFVMSPRTLRHPYLLYVSLLTFAGSFAGDVLPWVPRGWMRFALGTAPEVPRKFTPRSSATSSRMEQSYDVIGSDTQTSDDEGDDMRQTLEVAREECAVRTALNMLGFGMAIVGLWGDGGVQSETYVFEL